MRCQDCSAPCFRFPWTLLYPKPSAPSSVATRKPLNSVPRLVEIVHYQFSEKSGQDIQDQFIAVIWLFASWVLTPRTYRLDFPKVVAASPEAASGLGEKANGQGWLSRCVVVAALWLIVLACRKLWLATFALRSSLRSKDPPLIAAPGNHTP